MEPLELQVAVVETNIGNYIKLLGKLKDVVVYIHI